MRAERFFVGLIGVLALAGCEGGEAGPADTQGAGVAGSGDRLVVVTTDFATGAVAAIDLSTGEGKADLALASTDAIPYVHEGRVYVVNRFMSDYVDVLDPADGWSLVAQHAIEAVGTEVPSTNPQAVGFLDGGLALLTMYGAPELHVYDFERPVGEALIDVIDLSSLADGDGSTEATLVIPHGDEAWVAVQRLDRRDGWAQAAPDLLVRIDAETLQLDDLDPERAGVQGVELPGQWPKQFRVDPRNADRVYVLNGRLLAFDMKSRSVEVVVSPEQMAEAGIDFYQLPQSFDVSDDGETLVFAAYQSDFAAVHIYRVPATGGVPERIHAGFNSVEKTLEVEGEVIWFGDVTLGQAGVRRLSMDGELLDDGPISTGLPPYSVAVLPAATP